MFTGLMSGPGAGYLLPPWDLEVAAVTAVFALSRDPKNTTTENRPGGGIVQVSHMDLGDYVLL